ncbi:MAG: hypothetical protein GX786_09215, partial [Clostridiales bacterium]|nr:hypothetical protein [Clostridiales bacterium]
MNKSSRNYTGYFLLIVAIIIISLLMNGGFNLSPNKRIEYDTLLSYVNEQSIERVAIRDTSLVGLKKGTQVASVDFPEKKYDFETTIGSSEEFIDASLQLVANKQGKEVNTLSVNDLPFKIEYRAPVVRPWYYDFIPLLLTLG